MLQDAAAARTELPDGYPSIPMSAADKSKIKMYSRLGLILTISVAFSGGTGYAAPHTSSQDVFLFIML